MQRDKAIKQVFKDFKEDELKDCTEDFNFIFPDGVALSNEYLHGNLPADDMTTLKGETVVAGVYGEEGVKNDRVFFRVWEIVDPTSFNSTEQDELSESLGKSFSLLISQLDT